MNMLEHALYEKMKACGQMPIMKLTGVNHRIIHIEGNDFRTFTRGFELPFDNILIKSMDEATRYLCEYVPGCVLGYTHSDDIYLLLPNYEPLVAEVFLRKVEQRTCSRIASMATMAFNKAFTRNAEEFIRCSGYPNPNFLKYERLIAAYERAIETGAIFSAQCYVCPDEEMTDYLYWQQQIAERNSIRLIAQAHFSHRALAGKSDSQIRRMLLQQKGVDLDDFAAYEVRGRCCIRHGSGVATDDNITTAHLRNTSYTESVWFTDGNIPLFKGDGKEYVEELIHISKFSSDD